MTTEMILKIIALVCSGIIGVTVLLTNKNNEDAAIGVMVFMAVVVFILFMPWELIIVRS